MLKTKKDQAGLEEQPFAIIHELKVLHDSYFFGDFPRKTFHTTTKTILIVLQARCVCWGALVLAMDLAAWRTAVEADWRVLEVAPKELTAEKEAPIVLGEMRDRKVRMSLQYQYSIYFFSDTLDNRNT